jgi:hypothetical protein
MKNIVRLYKSNPILALIINSIAFFVWITTIIIVLVILTVAFTGKG